MDDEQGLHEQEDLSIFGWTDFPDPTVGLGRADEPRRIVDQEELSVFGDTYPGVPNPLVGHVHPYPTRFHGPNWNQPMFTQPWVERPYVGVPFMGLGQTQDPVSALQAAVNDPLWRAASLVSSVLGAYHGYKRNKSVGWAIWWAVMGGIAPVITPTIAVAQGFGKPKGAK
jgi:hypothetical protein